jgi:hypothetical protein
MIAASVAPPLVSGVLFQPFHQLFAMCLSLLLFKLPARTSSDVKRSYAKVHYDERATQMCMHGRGEGCRRRGFSLSVFLFLFFFFHFCDVATVTIIHKMKEPNLAIPGQRGQ